MANQEKRLCPFKRAVTRDLNPKTGKAEMHERFEPCAKERCMAFRSGIMDRCLRLEVRDGT